MRSGRYHAVNASQTILDDGEVVVLVEGFRPMDDLSVGQAVDFHERLGKAIEAAREALAKRQAKQEVES